MPRLELIDPAASPEEAAAIVAALERFIRATAPATAPPGSVQPDRWRRAGLLEGVARGRLADELPHPWLDTA